jgi:hypothetical protein
VVLGRIRRSLRRWGVAAVVVAVGGAFLVSAPAAGAFPFLFGNSGDILPPSEGQSTLVQDPTWLAMKAAGRMQRGPDGALVAKPAAGLVGASSAVGYDNGYPASFNLPMTYSPSIVEPEGAGWDDAHHGFYDANYWNLCSAGAAAAAISYFQPGNLTSWPAGTFTEPYGPYRASTYWRSSDTGSISETGNGYSTVGRAYLMHLAEQVRPPSYTRSGLVKFDYYPTHGGSITDQRDAINWEISGHSPYWQNYFYAYHPTAGLTQLAFRLAVQSTLVDGRAPLVLAVYTQYGSDRLPNWTRQVAHSITVIGYNDYSATYRYVDTCGRDCGTLSNGGVHDVSQWALYRLLVGLGYGFLY